MATTTEPNLSRISLIGGMLNAAEQARTQPATEATPYPLDPARVAEFNAIIQSVAPGAPPVDASLIAAMARELVGDAGKDGMASIVRRLDQARSLESMASDAAWRLPATDAERVDTVMSYLERKDDLIPDEVPVLGMLDDAVLVELAQRALKREVEDYADFCRFREAEAKARGVEPASVEIERRDWLAWRRMLAQRHGQPVGRSFGDDGDAGPSFRVR